MGTTALILLVVLVLLLVATSGAELLRHEHLAHARAADAAR